jgi:hypothetical protein
MTLLFAPKGLVMLTVTYCPTEKEIGVVIWHVMVQGLGVRSMI